MRTLSKLYDQDFYAWTQRNANLLRQGRADETDLEHLAEEIEEMGKEQRHALRSQLRHLLVHLLKLQLSAATLPRPGWIEEIQNARAEVSDRLADNPSLRPQMPSIFAEIWPRASRQATESLRAYGEQPAIPQSCPFTLEQVLDDDFRPQR